MPLSSLPDFVRKQHHLFFNGTHKKPRCKIKGNFTKCFLMVFEQERGKTTSVLQTSACEAPAGQPCGRVENSFSLLVFCRKQTYHKKTDFSLCSKQTIFGPTIFLPKVLFPEMFYFFLGTPGFN